MKSPINRHFWFIIIPIIIIICIIIGYFKNVVSPTTFDSSVQDHFVLGFKENIAFWELLFLPIAVFVFSIYLIFSQFFKIRKYRKKHSISISKSKNPLKFIINPLLRAITLPKRLFIPQLAYIMLLVWALGWALYICALWTSGNSNSNVAEILGYSAMASLDLFLLDINGNLLDGTKQIAGGIDISLLKGMITLVAIMAAFCSFALVIKLFVRRLVSTYHANRVQIKNNKNNHVYIFFGINDKSRNLAKSIKRNDSQRGLIIFVDHNEIEEGDTDGLNNLIQQVSPTSNILPEDILNEHVIYLTASAELKDAGADSEIFNSLGLDEINHLLKTLSCNKPTKRNKENGECESEQEIGNQLHIFFISDNRDANEFNTKNVAEALNKMSENDISFKNNIQKKIYCQTRRDAVTSIIEDSRTNLDTELEIIVLDESVLSIERLKENVELHPINFVDIEIDDKQNIGTVKSEFTSLIIGFGETGRDALRFLYEYGAFLNASENKSERSAFKCHAIDSKMSNLAPHFIANHPAIFQHQNEESITEKLVFLHETTDKSTEFYNLLDEITNRLNYVVVAVGDDETNITIAVNILKYIRKKRNDISNLKILVRAYGKDTFSHLTGIANHYNSILKDETKGMDIFHVFGQLEELFTYENIVENSFKKRAIDYYNSYDEAYVLTEEGQSYGGTRTSWQERRKKALSKNILTEVEDLRRKESQDISNAWHSLTKLFIIKKILNKYCGNTLEKDSLALLAIKMFELDDNIPMRKLSPTEISYPNLDEEFGANFKSIVSILMTNLAKTEHLRWIAAHEALGYNFHEMQIIKLQDGKEKKITKDIIHKWHSCMTPWENLDSMPDSSVRLYDYLVVETSLRLHLKDIQNNSKSSSNQN